ncbi:MAG: esterase family protein [Hamadaea sp.]|uniref:alpha/beta hydrolase n=1 Tax=Hamadaea sp. TaxID=2024425 RepID=UPI0017ED2497|nr:alpha/beta hydrolase-fold protein [Hamadaea sp.]NUT18567.1 esterase family protein [Hamadaea sp.]
MRPTVSRRRLLTGTAATVAATAAAGQLGSPAHAAGLPVGNGFGLTVLDNQRWDARLAYVRFRSTELTRDPGVNILLPDGYDANPARRYPVLYLLHGGNTDFRQWHMELGAVDSTAGLEVIVVMPDCYKIGWYANHLRPLLGPLNWKNFHIYQLIPWIDANLRTTGSAAGRAVAGLSMGGYGAQKYAAEFPDRFAAVSSYSGPSNNLAADIESWIFVTPAADGQFPGAVYGGIGERHDIMTAENPWDRVESFRGKRIALYAGLTDVTPDAWMSDVQERVVHYQNAAFHQRLLDAGIPNAFHDYPGTHTGEHWARNFREDVPGIVAALTPAG